MRGSTPAGVTWPWASISVTFSPRLTRRARASSMPSTMLKVPGCRALKLPMRVWPAMSDTFGSSSGSTPRTMAGRSASSRSSMPCVSTNGAAPFTAGFLNACAASARQSGMLPLLSNTSTWASTDSMRSVTSFWKPFITDSTTISAATPRPMPAMEMSEMKEIKLLRPLRLPARV